jgi:hypothetical protein
MPAFVGRRIRRGSLLAISVAASAALVGCGTSLDTVSDNTPGTPTATVTVTNPPTNAGAGPAPTGEPPGATSSSPAPGNANAAPGSCNGTIGAAEVDEVEVPSGATCTLEGTTVNGNVSVDVRGTLIAHGVDVDGDVEAEGAAVVEVTGNSSIGGNLQVQQGGSSTVTNTKIDGDLELKEQSGQLQAAGNIISGNVEADSNSGGLTVSSNRIGGDLKCEDNSPAANGGGNSVSGSREEQCASL